MCHRKKKKSYGDRAANRCFYFSVKISTANNSLCVDNVAQQHCLSKVLTDTDGCRSRPPVVLLTDTDRCADKAISQHALVDHCVTVT